MFRKTVVRMVKKRLPENETLTFNLTRQNNETGESKRVATLLVDMENAQDIITWLVEAFNSYEKEEP